MTGFGVGGVVLVSGMIASSDTCMVTGLLMIGTPIPAMLGIGRTRAPAEKADDEAAFRQSMNPPQKSVRRLLAGQSVAIAMALLGVVWTGMVWSWSLCAHGDWIGIGLLGSGSALWLGLRAHYRRSRHSQQRGGE